MMMIIIIIVVVVVCICGLQAKWHSLQARARHTQRTESHSEHHIHSFIDSRKRDLLLRYAKWRQASSRRPSAHNCFYCQRISACANVWVCACVCAFRALDILTNRMFVSCECHLMCCSMKIAKSLSIVCAFFVFLSFDFESICLYTWVSAVCLPGVTSFVRTWMRILYLLLIPIQCVRS